MTSEPPNGKESGFIPADEVRRYYATTAVLMKLESDLGQRISNIEGQSFMARWLVAAVLVPSVTTIIMAVLMLLRIWTAP